MLKNSPNQICTLSEMDQIYVIANHMVTYSVGQRFLDYFIIQFGFKIKA